MWTYERLFENLADQTLSSSNAIFITAGASFPLSEVIVLYLTIRLLKRIEEFFHITYLCILYFLSTVYEMRLSLRNFMVGFYSYQQKQTSWGNQHLDEINLKSKIMLVDFS